MSNPTETLCCENCKRELNTAGNLIYGPSVWRDRIRLGAVLFLIPIALLFPVIGTFFFYIIPVVTVYLLTSFLPDVTRITCHHCGHRTEKLGRYKTDNRLFPDTWQATASSLSKDEHRCQIEPNWDGERSDTMAYSRDEKNRRFENRKRFNLVGSTPANRFRNRY